MSGLSNALTDNANLAAKLALRERVLRDMSATEFSVLDLFAGTGKIWSGMRSRVSVRGYVGFDKTPKARNILRGDSFQTIRSISLDGFNVIDVDTYGEPWEVASHVFARATRETALFLTHGYRLNIKPSFFVRERNGIMDRDARVISSMMSRYLGIRYLHMECVRRKVVRIYRVELQNVLYFGLVLPAVE